MEIKTTAEIIREFQTRDNEMSNALTMTDEYTKWVALDDVLKLIKKHQFFYRNGDGKVNYDGFWVVPIEILTR